MNMTEYLKVKDYSYEEYCEYLKDLHGKVLFKYGSSKNKKPVVIRFEFRQLFTYPARKKALYITGSGGLKEKSPHPMPEIRPIFLNL